MWRPDPGLCESLADIGPSESGSMMSSRIDRAGPGGKDSIAPLPVCWPLKEKPSFSRLYFNREKRSESSSMSKIFFMAVSKHSTPLQVTGPLRGSEFGIKGLLAKYGFVHR